MPDFNLRYWACPTVHGSHFGVFDKGCICLYCGVKRDSSEFQRKGVFVWRKQGYTKAGDKINSLTCWSEGRETLDVDFTKLEEVNHVLPLDARQYLSTLDE